jgi:lipid-A-disaccharide synthase-like uncharacterized protein
MNSFHSGLNWGVFWTIIGWTANAVFSSRFIVQWYATEKKKQVVVPAAFWWLSLVGSLLFLSYAIFYDKHHVIIYAYAFNWIPYARNLIIHYRHQKSYRDCKDCGKKIPPGSNYCPNCGARLEATASAH